jgi:hypothetical protein
MGMKLSKPGHAPGLHGIDVLDGIRRRGHQAGYVGADALYNNCQPADYQLPLRALGYQPTYGYRTDQHGIQAQAHGALLVEGTWYCPQMPQNLANATRDHHRRDNDPARIDQVTWRTRIDARARYALAPKGKPNDNDRQRYMCPAIAGRLQCPLKPASMGNDPRLPLVDPLPSPVGSPRVCQQTSISVMPEDGAKHWGGGTFGVAAASAVAVRDRGLTELVCPQPRAGSSTGSATGANPCCRYMPCSRASSAPYSLVGVHARGSSPPYSGCLTVW